MKQITTEGVERWATGPTADGRMNNRTKLKILTVLHGVMKRAKRFWKLPRNPITDVEKPVQTHNTQIDVFSPEEVMALVRSAESEQDAAAYLTAAFTGLRRGELVALRWRDVDFVRRHIRVTASYTERALTTPKSGKVRSVPMAPAVAEALAKLNARGIFDSDNDLVFIGTTGGYLDASALYRRYKLALERANLRSLRFHEPGWVWRRPRFEGDHALGEDLQRCPVPGSTRLELLDCGARLVFESGRPIAHVARDLGVPSETLRKYVRQLEADQGLRPDLPTAAEREEIKQLRKENYELRRANEILKAASVYFASELDVDRPK